MKPTRFLAIALCVVLLLSLCACMKEESEETLKRPEIGSMVEYRISDTEYLRVLYNDYYSNYGEWIRDGETIRLCVQTNIAYWGLFTARYGIRDLNLDIRELTLGKNEEEMGKCLATTDEGFLNSTALTIAETGEVLPITDIRVTEHNARNFDWATPEWKEFCAPEENAYYEIEKLSVKINSATREGEWITNDITVPVKIVFHDWFCTVEIFDLSDQQEKRIFHGNGHMENGALVMDEIESDMFYGNSVTALTVTKSTDP